MKKKILTAMFVAILMFAAMALIKSYFEFDLYPIEKIAGIVCCIAVGVSVSKQLNEDF
jgi:hypothetical protein